MKWPFKSTPHPINANADAPFTFPASVEIQAGKDGKGKPHISILGYNGGLMTVSGWGRVAIDLAGLDLPGQVPILADHVAALSGIIGQGKPDKTGGKLTVAGQLSDATDAAKTVLQLSKDGFTFQASVGVEPTKRKWVSPGESAQVNGQTLESGDEGFHVIVSGSLREISVVPLGADGSTNVSIAAKMPGRKDPMPTDALTIERERIATINAMLKPPENGWGIVANDVETLRASAIAGDVSLADLPAKVRDLTELQTIRGSRNVPSSASGPYLQAQRLPDNRLLEAAVASYVGLDVGKAYGDEVADAVPKLGITCLMDACKLVCQMNGKDVNWRDKDAVIKAAFSTRDFPDLLSNVANKTLERAYKAFPSVARMIARRLDAKDFKEHTGVRLTGDVVMEKTPGDGEIKHGVLKDQAFTYAIDTYAKMFGVSRQDLINDNAQGLAETPRLLGRGAALAIEEVFWALVLANTGSFFHTTNNNALTAVLGAVGLSSAVQLFLEQTDTEGKPVGVTPRFLCTPPSLKTTADELYTSRTFNVGAGSASDKVPAVNAFFGLYEPVASPWVGAKGLDGGSDTAWYLFGDPADVAAFGIAYLGGMEGPTLEQVDQPANKLGVVFRGWIDFGVCQIDHRGAVKSTGAG